MSKTNIGTISLNTNNNRMLNINVYKNNKYQGNSIKTSFFKDLRNSSKKSNHENSFNESINKSIDKLQRQYEGENQAESPSPSPRSENVTESVKDEREELDNIDLLETVYRTQTRPNFLKLINVRVNKGEESDINNVLGNMSKNVELANNIENENNNPDIKEIGLATSKPSQQKQENSPSYELKPKINNNININSNNNQNSYLNSQNMNEISHINKNLNISNLNNSLNNSSVNFALGNSVTGNGKKAAKYTYTSKFNNSISARKNYNTTKNLVNANMVGGNINSLNANKQTNMSANVGTNSHSIYSNQNMGGMTNTLNYDCDICEELKKELVKIRKEKMDIKLELNKCKKDLKSRTEENDKLNKIIAEKEKQSEKDREFVFKQEKEILRLSKILENLPRNNNNKEKMLISGEEEKYKMKIENHIKTLHDTNVIEKDKFIHNNSNNNQIFEEDKKVTENEKENEYIEQNEEGSEHSEIREDEIDEFFNVNI